MRLKCIILSMVLIASVGYPRPIIEFGMITTRFMMEDIFYYPSGSFNTEAIYEMYWGLRGELVMNLTRVIGFRFHPFEVKILDHGGTSVEFLSYLDTDLIITLSPRKRFPTALYGGFRYERFWNLADNDHRGFDPSYELRFGGSQYYRASDRILLCLEMEVFTKKQTQFTRVPIEDMVISHSSFAMGINRLSFGVRLPLVATEQQTKIENYKEKP